MTAISRQAVVNGAIGNGWQLQSSLPNPVITGRDLVAGWPEIQMVVGADDPDEWGGAREQLIRGTSEDDFFAGRWVSCAFKLRSDYKPQRSSTWPNFNMTGLHLHDSGYHDAAGTYKNAPQAQFGTGVWTKNEDTGVVLPEPHLGVMVSGGADWTNWWSKSKRFIHPDPVKLEHIYVQDVYFKLGVEVEVWLDGVPWITRQPVPPNWVVPEGPQAGQQMGVYYELTNYRPSNARLKSVGQPIVTWDQVMSFCGVKSGATRAEATLMGAPVPDPTPVLTNTQLLDSLWGEAMQTTMSGSKFHAGGESAPGHWLKAKGYKDQLKSRLLPDTLAAHADLLGFEFETSRGRAKVTGTTTWSDEYVVIEGVDGDWRSARSAKLVRRAIELEGREP